VTPEEIKKAITEGIAGAVAGIQTKITEMEQRTTEALKPLAELPTRLTALEEAATKPDPKKPEPKKGEGDPEDTGVLAKFEEMLKPLREQLDGYKQRDESAASNAKVSETVNAYLAANHPNLKGKPLERAKARLVAMNPADADAAKAAMASYREELADMGVDTKPFTAEPKKEGAVETQNLTPEQQSVARIKEIGSAKRDPLAAVGIKAV
jgi:hypothetical protein